MDRRAHSPRLSGAAGRSPARACDPRHPHARKHPGARCPATQPGLLITYTVANQNNLIIYGHRGRAGRSPLPVPGLLPMDARPQLPGREHGDSNFECAATCDRPAAPNRRGLTPGYQGVFGELMGGFHPVITPLTPHYRRVSRTRPGTSGFTLVELLVVVTIIVVLLALLVPALDRAVYQAELALCAANQKAGVTGVITYAMDFRRYYPDRNSPPTRTASGAEYPMWMPPFEFHDDENSPDLRPLLHPNYMDINGVFNDPLSLKVDLANSRPSTRIYGSYCMWFGYRYQANGSLENSIINNAGSVVGIQWERGMIKLGDKLHYRDYPGERFGVLIGDMSRFDERDDTSFASHPDSAGVMAHQRFQDQQNGGLVMTISSWGSLAARGPVDMNFGYDDGAVRRHETVQRDEADPDSDPDGRMVRLNQEADRRNPALYLHMPRR